MQLLPSRLTLVPFPTYPSNSFYCNHCNFIGTGLSYSCSECEFDLHIHCAHQTQSFHPSFVHDQPHFQSQIASASNPTKHFSHPHELYLQEMKDDDDDDDDADDVVLLCSGCEDNISSGSVFYKCNHASNQCDFTLHKSCFDLPREIRHKSHLEHTLALLAKPHSSSTSSSNYKDGKFACNACLQDGAAFVYNCSICAFDLHIECASLPESIKRTDHNHPLNLFYSNSNPDAAVQQHDDRKEEIKVMSFVCDVCRNDVDEMAWIYYCHECDFGTHLECAAFEVELQPAAPPAVKTDEELIRETEMKFALLQFALLQLLLNGGRERAAAGAGGIVKEITLLKSRDNRPTS